MLSTPRRIMLVQTPTDFRKSIDGLASVCELELKEQPLDGSLYVFTNRRRNALKMLTWSPGGFLLLYKRLERGRFRWPVRQATYSLMSQGELMALMEGIDLTRAIRIKLWTPKKD